MAPKRNRRHRTSARQVPTPDEVLSGRVEPGVDALLSLIHRVNPTPDEGLTPEEVEHRYRVKAQLQSVLVERFLSDLVITPDQEEENVVSITHRRRTIDACHALLPALEPEARSLVQRIIDESALETGPEPAAQPLEAPSSEEGPQGPQVGGDPLALGQEALEAYDYELARSHLEVALRQSGGGATAAASLLELLVDHLGEARQALDVEGRLSSEAARDPQVRPRGSGGGGRAARARARPAAGRRRSSGPGPGRRPGLGSRGCRQVARRGREARSGRRDHGVSGRGH